MGKLSLIFLLLLPVMLNTAIAAEVNETQDLTIQQYRVEALQDEYYRLKVSSDAAKQAVDKQKARVKQTEDRLNEAKKALAERQKEWQADQNKLKAMEQQLSVEEKKLNQIWDFTHRKVKAK